MINHVHTKGSRSFSFFAEAMQEKFKFRSRLRFNEVKDGEDLYIVLQVITLVSLVRDTGLL
jgi:hypothetical protein